MSITEAPNEIDWNELDRQIFGGGNNGNFNNNDDDGSGKRWDDDKEDNENGKPWVYNPSVGQIVGATLGVIPALEAGLSVSDFMNRQCGTVPNYTNTIAGFSETYTPIESGVYDRHINHGLDIGISVVATFGALAMFMVLGHKVENLLRKPKES